MDEERKDLTYREYAIAEGISYEAVRKKIERNKNNPILKKILTKDGKKYLTPEQQDFLSDHVRGKYIYKPDPDVMERFAAITAENEALKLKVRELQSALGVYERLQIGTSVPQEEHQKLVERVDALTADLSAKNDEITALKQTVEKISEELAKPRKKGIFGRYRD